MYLHLKYNYLHSQKCNTLKVKNLKIYDLKYYITENGHVEKSLTDFLKVSSDHKGHSC